ncbi:MAG: pantoate--beta-alanine ligase [Lentisphaerales bacterium]|jgi:pantoate--beta-alanine ligase|nr:MAG: pantoate--beta-alanine ligase [Lentisphaerales bacterium]
MKTVTSPAAMQQLSLKFREEAKTIALVPTMGCLHAGHLSLVHTARATADILVVSVFVNPMQFGPGEDLDAYPRDSDKDKQLCEDAGVDIFFFPSNDAMYPIGHSSFVEETVLSRELCGRLRPGHFRGVTTIVAKLLNIVLPHRAFFGQKDAQQALVVRKLVSDLSFPVEIVTCPTVRDTDGLALSSRNKYMSTEERNAALCVPGALEVAEQAIRSGTSDARMISSAMQEALKRTPGVKVDYVEVVDPSTLEPIVAISGPALVAVAVRIGRTRLIDNRLIGGPDVEPPTPWLPPSP